MIRRISLSFIIGVCALSAGAEYSDSYYSRMNGKRREELKAAAKECVVNHKMLEYYELPTYWAYSDVYPELVDGCRRWWDMYSDEIYLIRPGESGRSSFSRNKMQREHAVPKSWWKKAGSVEYTPAYSDMWNLYPSDGTANQAKLNYPFGITSSPTFDNGVTKVGGAMRGYGGGSPNVFEPADRYKGDFARAIFYMATVYDDINWVYHYMFDAEAYPTLTSWAVSMLLQWARQDPVSQKEIDRNNYVEQYQGNRNPFVDFPELAEYIWGSRTTETFYVADQANSDPTPPITGDPEITAPVNGEALDFGQAAVGHAVARALQISGHNLTSSLSVRVSGTDRNSFIPETTVIPHSTMNASGGYLLNILYRPTAVGSHQARLILYDGGIDGSIAVDLRGEALPVPEMSTLRALAPEDISDGGYTARWEAPSGIADYYTLHRVRYVDGNEEAESYETGDTSFRITDRNPDVAESYTVTYNRLGIDSPESNTIYVAANGIRQIDAAAPLRIFVVEGGLRIVRGEGESGELTITDASGLLYYSSADAPDGTFISLSPGIYIARTAADAPRLLIVK